MIPRLGPLILLALMLPGGALIQSALAQTPIPPVAVDVGGEHLTLAPADADAFQRRLNQPPLLDDPPPVAAPSYTVTTAYWDPAVREEQDEPAIDRAAEYFPAGGFVRARQDDEDVWLVLDLRQRAILDHYIRYGTQQGLPADPVLKQAALNPSALLIAFLGYYGQGESVAIEVGDRLLTADEAEAFWVTVAPWLYGVTFFDPPRPPRSRGASGYWVRLIFPEGRALSYFLDTSAHTLTDALGTETHDLSNAAGGGIPDSADVSLIEDESPAGSKLWWLLAVGAGVLLLAAAMLRGSGSGASENA